MKKLILFAAILFVGVSMVNAQNIQEPTTAGHKSETQMEGGISSATTELMVTLTAIQSISVNTANINLEYKTVSDYSDGVQTGMISDHLNVYSTGGYLVNVNYELLSDNYSDFSPAAKKNANDLFKTIKVIVDDQESSFLDLEPKTVITSDEGGMNLKFDVNYVGSNMYRDFIEKNKTRVYKANVVYSILPN